MQAGAWDWEEGLGRTVGSWHPVAVMQDLGTDIFLRSQFVDFEYIPHYSPLWVMPCIAQAQAEMAPL